LLDEDHTKCDECSLANKINTILGHRFENLHSILEASARASDTKSEGRATSDMGVVTLAEQLDDPRDLARVLEEEESKRGDSCASDII
jgi:hypothetical protein